MWVELGRALDRWATRHGRKLLLVDFYGQVIMHRYTVFNREPTGSDLVATQWWPTLYVHRFLKEESPDGPTAHSHAGNTWSLVLRGCYREQLKGRVRTRTAGTVQYIAWPEVHKIVWVQRDTWTLFFRGLRKSKDVRVVPEVCDVLCERCGPRGTCYNIGKEFNYSTYARQYGSKTEGLRLPQWQPAGPATEALIARRVKAVQRLKLKVPQSAQEQLKVASQHSRLTDQESV